MVCKPNGRGSWEAQVNVTILPSKGPLVAFTVVLLQSQRMGSASVLGEVGYSGRWALALPRAGALWVV